MQNSLQIKNYLYIQNWLYIEFGGDYLLLPWKLPFAFNIQLRLHFFMEAFSAPLLSKAGLNVRPPLDSTHMLQTLL